MSTSRTPKESAVSTPSVVTPNSSDVNSDSVSEDNSVTTPDVNSNSDNSESKSQEETKPVDLSPGNVPQDVYTVMREKLEGMLKNHNALAEQIKNAGDRVALKDSLKDNPDQTNDNDFIALVARMNELTDALASVEREFDAASEPIIVEHLKRSGVDKKQEEADEIAKAAKATIAFFNAMGASTDGLPSLINRSGRTNSTSGDGRGSGVPKYRGLDVYVDGARADQKFTVKGKNGEPDTHVRKSNLTYGAQAANVPNDVFRAKFIEAQGTSDAANFKDRVEFNVTDGNGKSHAVVVIKLPQD